MTIVGHDRIADYVHDHGANFVPAPRPRGMRKRADKACFLNALKVVMDHPEQCAYVEGLGTSAEGFGPVHHAWITGTEGRDAIELTWPEPGIEYIGVAFTAAEVATIAAGASAWGGALPIIVRGGVTTATRPEARGRLLSAWRGARGDA